MIAPTILPGAAYRKITRGSRLLFYWRAEDRSLVTVNGLSTGTFTRASAGGLTDGRGYVRPSSTADVRLVGPHADNQPRFGVSSAGIPHLLLEGQRTNLLLGSTPDNTGSPWGGELGFTLTAVTAALAGTTPYKHTNKNLGVNESRTQTIGTLTAAPETLSLIIENVDAVKTYLGIFDGTISNWVVRGELTWATGAFVVDLSGVGTDTSASVESMGTGPNGGAMYRVSITGTPNNTGNVRRVTIYATGVTQNGEAVILHHVQYEEASFASSPIPTVASTVTRAAEVLSWPFLAPPRSMTVYVSMLDWVPTVSDTVWHIGAAGAATDPRIVLATNASGQLFATFDDGSTEAATGALAAPSAGDNVEVLVTLTSAGVVDIAYALNAGPQVDAASAVGGALATAWAGQLLYLNSVDSSTPGFGRFAALKIAPRVQTMEFLREAF